ncbi:MAG: endo-1,4-beta-xylanase [Prevotella sp.]|nr:endo-1,4-beta-xylanase [Prevotella sp.]
MNFATVSEFVNNATDAGMSVYGHTLAWHSQQPVKWLNSLLADKPAPIPEGGANACIVYDCGDAGANPWDKQAHYKLPIPMEKGKTYVVKARVKADNGGDFGLWPIWDASPNRDQWGGSADVSYQASYPITSSFSDLEWTFEAPFPIDKLQFVFGKIGGKVYIDDLSCKEKGSDAEMVKNGSFDEDSMDGWGNNWNGPSFSIEGQAAGPATFFVSLINNGDMEGDDAANFAKKENAGATVYEITDGVGKNGSRGVKIASNGGQPDAWESQFWIVSNEVLHIGDKIHVAFDYRADGGCAGTNVDTQAHFGPGEYQHWACAGTVSFSNEWQTYDKTFTVDESMAKKDDTGMKSIAFNMSPNAADGAYYIDNVVLEIEKSGDGIPLTPEERKDTLTWAMEQWIAGMMEACDGKVKAWDVVNEAISGGDPDGEGVYALQHGTPDNTTDFFWQDEDKLGDLDYVRTAVRLARQYGPEDIKLFINDYNLESDWDQNNKLKSLIAWIKRWEADGVTKIDGIGSQMHISCYANPTTQASKKAAIENMLKLMASSGKLCRISELDMGYVDADGNSVKTDDMTEEMHHQMAELYTFVIEKYKEIIPVNQQWGICQWCATDAPADSGWRKGEPVGLWDSNYYRKHTYAGFADGLAGK